MSWKDRAKTFQKVLSGQILLYQLLSSYTFVKISITALELMVSALHARRNFDGYGRELDCSQLDQRKQRTCNSEEQLIRSEILSATRCTENVHCLY